MAVLLISERKINFVELEKILVAWKIGYRIAGPSVLDNVNKFDFQLFDALIYYGIDSEKARKAFAIAGFLKYKRAIYLSSILSYFDRINPDWNLQAHSYVQKITQCEKKLELLHKHTSLITLELPFVGRSFPAEYPIVNNVVGVEKRKHYMAPSGCTAEISVYGAARAVFATLVNGRAGMTYTICDGCRKYTDILKSKLGGNVDVEILSQSEALSAAKKKEKSLKSMDIESQFDIRKLYTEDLQKNMCFDATFFKADLGYDRLFRPKGVSSSAPSNTPYF